MSFKNYDKQNFIIDTANAYTRRKISKRDFLSKMGIAGIGMSAFATGVLGGARPFRGNMAHAAENNTPEDVAKFLKEAGKSFAGTTIRYTSEATPPTVVLDFYFAGSQLSQTKLSLPLTTSGQHPHKTALSFKQNYYTLNYNNKKLKKQIQNINSCSHSFEHVVTSGSFAPF